CADRNRDLDGGYACALRELQVRRDVYAFDAFAWVCLKRGDAAEALAAIEKAMAGGTKDAAIVYHAATIYAANHKPMAITLASQALALKGTLTAGQMGAMRSIVDAHS